MRVFRLWFLAYIERELIRRSFLAVDPRRLSLRQLEELLDYCMEG